MTERSFDTSKLKADGSHYAGVAFDLPYCLHLPYDHYPVRIEAGGRTVVASVQLESHRRSDAGRGGFFVPPQKAEKIADPRGVYRYSSVVVYIPIRSSEPESHGDKERIWKRVDAQRHGLLEQSVSAVNQLVRVYRFCTQECHIRALSGPDLWFDHNLALVFTEYDPSGPTSKASVTHLPLHYDGDIVPQIPPVPEQVQDQMRELLLSGYEVPLFEELLLNAHDLLYQGNYRLSVIEGETAFEVATWRLVREHHSERGRSDEWIDNMLGERPHSFTAKLQTRGAQEAFEALEKEFAPGSEFYEMWKERVWKLRGGLVHGRIADASPQEAAQAIDMIEETLVYLLERPRTKPWRYLALPPLDL